MTAKKKKAGCFRTLRWCHLLWRWMSFAGCWQALTSTASSSAGAVAASWFEVKSNSNSTVRWSLEIFSIAWSKILVKQILEGTVGICACLSMCVVKVELWSLWFPSYTTETSCPWTRCLYFWEVLKEYPRVQLLWLGSSFHQPTRKGSSYQLSNQQQLP